MFLILEIIYRAVKHACVAKIIVIEMCGIPSNLVKIFGSVCSANIVYLVSKFEYTYGKESYIKLNSVIFIRECMHPK